MRASTSLEFAILAVPFLMLVLGTMELGYDFFVLLALQNAVHVASRSTQIGTVTGAGVGAAASTWVGQAVCPALGALLDCGQLYVSLTWIPSSTGSNYYTYLNNNPITLQWITSSSASICTGTGGELMLLRAYYLSPTFIGMLVPAWSQTSPVNGGQLVHVTYAATGYVNEYFSGGKAGC